VLPPNKSRILYFSSVDIQLKWTQQIRKIVGEQNVNDFYEVSTNLGKGQFGVVKLAKHKKTKNHVAIKTITKANMKPIEVY
jgi:serine/threonine protein kinase